MGKSMGSEIKEFSMIVEKEPAEVKDVISIGLKDFTIHYLEEDWSKEDILKKIENQELDLYVVYPDNLLGGSSITNVPNVEMYYNSASDASLQAYTLYSEILNAFEDSMTNLFDINHGDTKYDLAKEEALTVRIFTMMLPFLLITFLFSEIGRAHV